MTVVSLLSASCGYSRRHAVLLDRLRQDLVARGVPVHFIGINARQRSAQLMASELDRLVNFTMYQSSHREHYWSQLGGLKDDVFVYDKCGRLTYFVPFPQSFVPLRFVELAIQSTHDDSPCGPPNSNSTIIIGIRPLAHHSTSRASQRRTHSHKKCNCLPGLENAANEEHCLCRSRSDHSYGSLGSSSSESCYCKFGREEVGQRCRCHPSANGQTCQCSVAVSGPHALSAQS